MNCLGEGAKGESPYPLPQAPIPKPFKGWAGGVGGGPGLASLALPPQD
jgi:hypothetical protein